MQHRFLSVPLGVFSATAPRAAVVLLLLCAFFTPLAHPAPITFNWDYTVSGAAGFALYCGQASRTYSNRWDVGNTTTATISSLSEGQSYFCAVTAYDSGRVESAYSSEASFTVPYGPLSVNFSAAPTTGTAPLSVTFTNTTTGQVTSWAWNFGDGTTSTAKSPTHSYSQNGTYTVILTATGPGGTASKTATNAITVGASTGLVAAYGFDEGTGTTVKDTSPYGNTGTISSATWMTTGRFGKALSFNGSSSWVTVNDANSLDLTTGMTIEAWVYPTALSGWRSVIMKESTTDEVYGLYANIPQVSTVTSGGLVNVSTAALPLNRWTHLAGTYDGVTQRLYVNGVQVASKSRTGAMAASTRPLRIGGDSLWGEYFQGLIDEVRIYNRARTATQIQADMNTPVSWTSP